MGDRGRPPQNGAKSGWTLFRDLVVLHEFDRARKNGEKYEATIDLCIGAVHDWFPAMPISKSEVYRILARYRSGKIRSTLVTTYREAVGPEAAHYATMAAELAAAAGNTRGSIFNSSTDYRVRILEVRQDPPPIHRRVNATEYR